MSRSFVGLIGLLAACRPVPEPLVPFLRDAVEPPHASLEAADAVVSRLDSDGRHAAERWAEAARIYTDALQVEVLARPDVALEDRGWGLADAGTVIDRGIQVALVHAAAQEQPRDDEESADLVEAALGLSFHLAVRQHLGERTTAGFDAAFGYAGLGFGGQPDQRPARLVDWNDPASYPAWVEAFHTVRDTLAVGVGITGEPLGDDPAFDEAAELIDAVLVRAQALDAAAALDEVASSPKATAPLVRARVGWEAARAPVGVLDATLAARIDGLLYPGDPPDRSVAGFWLQGLDAIAAGEVTTAGAPAADAVREAVDRLGTQLP